MSKTLRHCFCAILLSLLCGMLVFVLPACGKKEKPPVIPTFSVEFFDEDKDTLISSLKVLQGENAQIESPSKEPTAYFVFSFSHWVFEDGSDATKSLAAVTEDLKVFAKYVQEDRFYRITFCEMDGTLIQAPLVKAGEDCNLNFHHTPPSDDEYEFKFDCWVDADGVRVTDAFKNVLSDVTVYAKYTKTKKTFSLSFSEPFLRVKHGSGTFITSELAPQVKLHAGDLITIQYDVPEGFSWVLVDVKGAIVVDESAGIYRVVSNVEILAVPMK